MATNHGSERRLGTESIGKLLVSLAIPAVTAQLVNVLYNMVDRIYIGHMPGIGGLALTGAGTCIPVIMMISAFAALASMGGAPRASILMGQGKKNEAEQVLGNCATTLMIIAVFLTLALLIFGRPMLFLFGASNNTIDYAWDYMRIYVLGTIFVQMALGLNAFITAQGFAKISMMTVLIGAVLNIILDPVFIFGFHMGVKGAALATIIAQAVSAFWVVHFLTHQKAILRIRLKNMWIVPKVIAPCLLLGLSPFIMQSTESLLAVCFNASLQHYGGDLAVGAMTILTTVRQFILLPLQGLTQGAQPIMSFNYGAGNTLRLKKAFELTLKTALLYASAIWAISMFAPKIFILLFTKEAELIETTVWAIRIYMAVAFTASIQNTCQQTFIAIGNAKTSIFLALLRKMVLLIPLIYILPVFLSDPLFAVYLAEPIADFIAASVTGLLFFRQLRQILKK